jgi:hypothetical protein
MRISFYVIILILSPDINLLRRRPEDSEAGLLVRSGKHKYEGYLCLLILT